MQIEDLREQFLSAEASATVRWLAIGLALLLLGVVLRLVRNRTLREEFTPLWVTTALIVFAVALQFDVLRALTRLIGAWTVSSTLFFVGGLFLLSLALTYSVRLSRHGEELKMLTQDVAILRARLAEVEDRDRPAP